MSGKRFIKFLAYYKPYKKIVFIDLFCALIASITSLSFPILVNVLTKQAIVSQRAVAMSMIIRVGLVFVAILIVEYICNYYITYIGHVAGMKMEFDMRNDLFNHFQKLSFSYYDNAKTGQLMSRITTDLFDVTELAHHGPEDVLISIIKIVGSFIILCNVNLLLSVIIFSVLPFMIAFTVHYNKKMRQTFKKNREKIADVNAQIEDSLSGIRVVKSFANEELEIAKFLKGNTLFAESKKNSYKYLARFHTGLSLLITATSMGIVIVGALFIVTGKLDVSDLITFMLYISLLLDPVKRLMNFTEQFQSGATGFERFMEIMEIEPDIEDDKDAIDIKNVKGKIEFQDVSFSYSAAATDVLKGLNIVAEVGDYIALVGPSGVGKTTLCSLIPRFYEVSEGTVRLDGVDIKSIKLKSLRDNIGIVQQDVYLFAGSVMENIRYGKKDATDEEIIAAAKNANAHEFIMKLPNGYDTYIGQRGIKLSGGQKQRLSIARVFLKNPPVLIFDEATSSLDNESEKIVQESFERLAKNRTTFVIAHRLSTIKNAKRIMVLTENGIEEEGTHEQLLQQGGVYAGLYNI